MNPTDLVTPINAAIVALLPILVTYIRKLTPKLPRVVVWALPMVLGGILTWVAQATAGVGPGTAKGILLGAIALVVRELVTTVQEHGVNG